MALWQQKKKETRGGKRAGAGRKKLAPTKTVSFRVKEEDVENVKNVVSEFLGGKKNKEKNATYRIGYLWSSRIWKTKDE